MDVNAQILKYIKLGLGAFATCLFLVVFSGLPVAQIVKAQSNSVDDINAGIVTGAWISKLPVFDSEDFKVKTAFQNNSGFDIIGRAIFFDNNSKIASHIFNVKNSKLIEISTNVEGKYGEHQYSIKIEVYKEADVNDLDNANVEIDGDLLFTQTAETFSIFIDYDTDGDGVGNDDDNDDDNDGITDDVDEDPLNAPPNVTEKVINKIQEDTATIFQKVNNFTENMHESFTDKVSSVRDEIDSLKDKAEKIIKVEVGDELIILTSDQKDELDKINKEKNLKYGQLALLTTAMTFFSNQWFFWVGIVIISYLIFLLLRKLVRRLFREV